MKEQDKKDLHETKELTDEQLEKVVAGGKYDAHGNGYNHGNGDGNGPKNP